MEHVIQKLNVKIRAVHHLDRVPKVMESVVSVSYLCLIINEIFYSNVRRGGGNCEQFPTERSEFIILRMHL
jgi:hypothetical protein